ncbi:hypothetical protein BJX62DRAFT_221380 [Aspergillus germanicus]
MAIVACDCMPQAVPTGGPLLVTLYCSILAVPTPGWDYRWALRELAESFIVSRIRNFL